MNAEGRSKFFDGIRQTVLSAGFPMSSYLFAEINGHVQFLEVAVQQPQELPLKFRDIGRSLRNTSTTWVAFMAPFIIIELERKRISEKGLLFFESSYAGEEMKKTCIKVTDTLNGPTFTEEDGSRIPTEFVQDGLDALWIGSIAKEGGERPD